MTERLHFHFSLSCIGEGNGNPLQCSCQENPRDGEAWWAAVSGVAHSRTRLRWLSSSSSSHNCWVCALNPGSRNYWKSSTLEFALQQEKPPPWEACTPCLESSPLAPAREKQEQQWRPKATKRNAINFKEKREAQRKHFTLEAFLSQRVEISTAHWGWALWALWELGIREEMNLLQSPVTLPSRAFL